MVVCAVCVYLVVDEDFVMDMLTIDMGFAIDLFEHRHACVHSASPQPFLPTSPAEHSSHLPICRLLTLFSFESAKHLHNNNPFPPQPPALASRTNSPLLNAFGKWDTVLRPQLEHLARLAG